MEPWNHVAGLLIIGGTWEEPHAIDIHRRRGDSFPAESAQGRGKKASWVRTHFKFDLERMARFGQVEMSMTVWLEGLCWQSEVVEKYGLWPRNGKKSWQTRSPVPEQLTGAFSGQCQTQLAFLRAACFSTPFIVLSLSAILLSACPTNKLNLAILFMENTKQIRVQGAGRGQVNKESNRNFQIQTKRTFYQKSP